MAKLEWVGEQWAIDWFKDCLRSLPDDFRPKLGTQPGEHGPYNFCIYRWDPRVSTVLCIVESNIVKADRMFSKEHRIFAVNNLTEEQMHKCCRAYVYWQHGEPESDAEFQTWLWPNHDYLPLDEILLPAPSCKAEKAAA